MRDFDKFSKLININNLDLGEKLLDFVIEMIQGPCLENQINLCNTKLLENLEDILFDLSSRVK